MNYGGYGKWAAVFEIIYVLKRQRENEHLPLGAMINVLWQNIGGKPDKARQFLLNVPSKKIIG